MFPAGGASESGRRMSANQEWKDVCDFWFPPGLDEAGPEKHREMILWWFGGGANEAVRPFTPLIAAAAAGRLDSWRATPRGRLALILVLDQFPRCVFAGTPAAYAGDPQALAIAEEGLRNGHFEALAKPWEKTFAFMPLGHTEGPDHRERLQRVVALAETIARAAPPPLQALYGHSINQARGHLEVIERFGRFPHRNPVLGRSSSAEEQAYLSKGEFVHQRRPP